LTDTWYGLRIWIPPSAPACCECGNAKYGLRNGLPRDTFGGGRAAAGALLLANGLYPRLINLYGYRPLQESYRQQQALLPPVTQQDSLYATKWAVHKFDFMSNLQERPWLCGQSGFDGGLDRDDFGCINGCRISADANHVNDSRSCKNWEPIQYVKPTEHVTSEKREIDFFKTVGPPALAFV
jgi:hypothetical protein